MRFRVLSHGSRIPTERDADAYLRIDNWDDWFKYNTMYFVFDSNGEIHEIGGVKVGEFNMGDEQRRARIPDRFEALGDQFFSLGQDDSYYENLKHLGSNIRRTVLRSLRDVALDLDLFARALDEKVTGISLLRSVRTETVKGQFHRMALGGVRLSEYDFTYTLPVLRRSKAKPASFSFSVEPLSQPPTNIHVVIGRNGVGKTRLLHYMTRALVEDDDASSILGSFETTSIDDSEDGPFANIVSVTFSAFDPFDPLPERQDKSSGVQYAYVGLKRRGKDRQNTAPKSPDELSRDFSASFSICRKGARARRWRNALATLESDYIFRDAEITRLADTETDTKEEEDELRADARKLFGKLSSGHKIVLLTITRLVETVAERTLVLIDEPEAHLHPPLLSAFVRALSNLLIDRNGVAIIATHSPVVLQEVPTNCVWKMRRNGEHVIAERPLLETFGENVGVLTREVFGLEVTHSGFHKLLQDSVGDGLTYGEVLDRFSNRLGGEAKAITRALINSHEDDEPS